LSRSDSTNFGSGRRFVYYVAMSADGMIARADGSIDWLTSRPDADYGGATFFASVDTIVWGRRTYDHGLVLGGLKPFGPKMRHVVVTHHPTTLKMEPGFQVETAEDPGDLADRLRKEPAGRDVWVMGGSELAGTLLDAGAVDELFIHVIPVLLGNGIPLLRPAPRDVRLSLVESKAFPDGVVRLRYAIERAPTSGAIRR